MKQIFGLMTVAVRPAYPWPKAAFRWFRSIHYKRIFGCPALRALRDVRREVEADFKL